MAAADGGAPKSASVHVKRGGDVLISGARVGRASPTLAVKAGAWPPVLVWADGGEQVAETVDGRRISWAACAGHAACVWTRPSDDESGRVRCVLGFANAQFMKGGLDGVRVGDRVKLVERAVQLKAAFDDVEAKWDPLMEELLNATVEVKAVKKDAPRPRQRRARAAPAAADGAVVAGAAGVGRRPARRRRVARRARDALPAARMPSQERVALASRARAKLKKIAKPKNRVEDDDDDDDDDEVLR